MVSKPVILGGGLWGGLLAWRWNTLYPDVPFLLVEKEKKFGGNHTWSFHGKDVGESIQWLSPFIEKSWNSYEVIFPEHFRHMKLDYHSISSEKFHSVLSGLPSEKYLLGSESHLSSDWQIDARGQYEVRSTGWQKFLGLEIKTTRPHGMAIPVLMDARIPQSDGFRFLYYLPFSEDRILVELTSYSNSKEIDEAEYESVVLEKLREKNISVESIMRKERASLPIPIQSVTRKKEKGVIHLSGIFHDTTGYSLPYAVSLIDQLLLEKPTEESFGNILDAFEKKIAKDRAFFRLLNRFMFRASSDHDRYKMLQFFYKHSPDLISNFYRGRLSTFDKIRFFLGKPPVSISKAMKEVLE